ncbi:DUF4114 domain-containing protein [Brunnivagina elsteri]|uniref:PEP-CTERM sorting domain-containing protein n=1 Tax=Brunnivagina elsteri CCALA 953 TaxID=987040 RepID=A0A2A2TCF2_9CYAN|nr:DUF4114 domain-containing protein [Calothrix elsteri]PAX51099.1 PEP-CTERM sorting domain-containing protein [Calothrix elsteri CCALA 953]
MNNKLFAALFTATAVTGMMTSTSASASATTTVTPSPAIQSRDTAPDYFKNNLQNMKDFVGKEARQLDLKTINAQKVDLSNFVLKYQHDVNVFFLGETAGGYRNRLDYKSIFNGNTNTGKLFGDTSCSTTDSIANFSSFCANPNDAIAGRSKTDSPLKVGDWVSIGNQKAGTQLDFLLHSNDINGGISGTNVKTGQANTKGVWSLNDALNPDGLQHAMAYYYNDLLVVGFEDLWGGGDKDYNDTVFVIDVGKDNARALAGITSVPEPSGVAALLGVGAIGFLKLRRRSSLKVNVKSE